MKGHLKIKLLTSLAATITIPGSIFYSITTSYSQIYISILAIHFIYTFILLWLTGVRTNHYLLDFLAITTLVALTEIALSAISVPISYVLFLNDFYPFDCLLPYFGSEISLGILAAVFALLSRVSSALTLLICLIVWLIPIPKQDLPISEDSIRVTIVQTVLPQHTTSYPGISDGLEYWKTHLIQALEESSKQEPDLVILPESSMPSFHSSPTPVVRQILNSRGSHPLIAHHYVDTEEHRISSQVKFWSSDHQVLARHEKYSPLPIAEQFIVPGREASFSYNGLTLAPFICSESLNIYKTRLRLTESDAGIILVNAAEVAHTYLPEFHLISDRIRARELGVPILRAANIRLSTYIDGQGKIVQVTKDSAWQNLYVNLILNKNTFFSYTFITQHILIITAAIMLLIQNKFIIYSSPSLGIYILFLACIICVQFTYGYERNSPSAPEKNVSFYADQYFPARQLGITAGIDTELIDVYLDTSHIAVKDIPLSRGVGVVNTTHGRMYITERRGDKITTLSERGFLMLRKKQLEDISLSKVLWYAYKP